jgi:hypothetical protein
MRGQPIRGNWWRAEDAEERRGRKDLKSGTLRYSVTSSLANVSSVALAKEEATARRVRARDPLKPAAERRRMNLR